MALVYPSMFTGRFRDRAREKRLARLARGCGLELIRSPWWLRGVNDFPYALIDPARNTLMFGNETDSSGVSLDEIEEYLDAFRRDVRTRQE